MPPEFYFPIADGGVLAADRARSGQRDARRPLPRRGRPAEAGRRASQAAAEMKTIAERLAVQYPGCQRERVGRGHLAPRTGRRRRPAGAAHAARRRRRRHPDRLRQRRQPAARPRVGPREGDGHPRRRSAPAASRLVLQMLAESLVLAVAGGGLGLLLAYLAIAPIQTLGAGSIPRVADVAIDGTVLVFAAVAVARSQACSSASRRPGRRRAAGRSTVLKEGGRSSVGAGGRWLRRRCSWPRWRCRSSCWSARAAAAQLRQAHRCRPGLRRQQRARVPGLAAGPRPTPRAHTVAFFDALIEKLGASPGVRRRGMVQTLPMRGGYVLSFTVQGRRRPKPGDEPSANYRVDQPGYFQALGIPLKRGRASRAQDAATAPMVAIVDESFVRKHFPTRTRSARASTSATGPTATIEIVGVVGDVALRRARRESPEPTMYVPFEQECSARCGCWRGPTAIRRSWPRRAAGGRDRSIPTLPAYSIDAAGDSRQRVGRAAAVLDAAAGALRRRSRCSSPASASTASSPTP